MFFFFFFFYIYIHIYYYYRPVDDSDRVDDELKITTQVIRDGVLARTMQYEEQNSRSRTPTLDTVRQCMRDAVYARQLAKYQTMGYDV